MNPENTLDLWSFYSSLKPASADENRFELDEERIEGQPILSGFKRINFFIGPNNSGKSQLIRSFTQEFGAYVLKIKANPFLKCLLEFDEAVSQRFKTPIDSILMRRVHNSGIPSDFIWQERFGKRIGRLDKNSGQIRNLNDVFKFEINRGQATYLGSEQNGAREFEDQFSDRFDALETYLKNIQQFYVPTDRKLYAKTHREAFDHQLKTSLFGKDDNKVQVFTGSEMYQEILNLRTSSKKKNLDLLDFEAFLGKEFFEGKEVFFSPVPKSLNHQEDLHIKIGDEEDRPFYQLGEGIQSLIIISYLSRFKEKALIAIEEPENNLHPGLQKKLIEVLLDEGSQDNMILATTHSNHFLEYLHHPTYKDQISFFRVEKQIQEGGKTLQRASKIQETEVDLLDQLGVSNHSVFLANCVIWVEGISDVIYLRKYLEVYKKSLVNYDKHPHFPFATMNEGLHYTFAFSGGNLLAHFEFDKDWQKGPGINARAIANRFLFISDDGNKKFLKDLKRQLNDSFIQLSVKEIENTLSQRVVEKVVKTYPTLASVSFKEVDEECWKTFGMGYIIDNLLIQEPASKKRKKFSVRTTPDPKTATIVDKTEFAALATGCIESVEDLSTYSRKTLIPRVVDFIKKANGKLES